MKLLILCVLIAQGVIAQNDTIYLSVKSNQATIHTVIEHSKEADSLYRILKYKLTQDSTLKGNCDWLKSSIKQKTKEYNQLDSLWVVYFGSDEGLLWNEPTEKADSVKRELGARMREIQNDLYESTNNLTDLATYGEILQKEILSDAERIKELRTICWYMLTKKVQTPKKGSVVLIKRTLEPDIQFVFE